MAVVSITAIDKKKAPMSTPSLPISQIKHFCQEHPIERLSLFGSALRGEFEEHSDIDLLIVFEQGAPITFLTMYDLEQALSGIIGHPVDLRTPEELSPFFRDDVLKVAQVLYDTTSR